MVASTAASRAIRSLERPLCALGCAWRSRLLVLLPGDQLIVEIGGALGGVEVEPIQA